MEKIAGISFPVVDSSVERAGHFLVDGTMACILLDLKATRKKSLSQSEVSFLSACLSFFLLLQVYEVFYTSIILSLPHSHKKHLEMFLCNFLVSLNSSVPFSLPILFNLFLS